MAPRRTYETLGTSPQAACPMCGPEAPEMSRASVRDSIVDCSAYSVEEGKLTDDWDLATSPLVAAKRLLLLAMTPN